MKYIKYMLLSILVLFTIAGNTQEKQSYTEISAITKEITSKYFTDYISLDFDSMKAQANENISFDDTTAKLIFGLELVEGKAKVFDNFNKTYAAIVKMETQAIRTIFSGQVGIFETQLTYTFKAGPGQIITIEKMPFIVTLTVEDGKISEHRDYADYNHFIEQYSAQTKP